MEEQFEDWIITALEQGRQPGGLDPLEYQAALDAHDIEAKARDLRNRDAARKLVDAEKVPHSPPFDAGSLNEILARPTPPPARITDWMPWEAALLLVAQRKVGKTTLLLHICFCLLTGFPFLGRYPVRPVDGNIALLNFEVSAAQLARWAQEVGVPGDRLFQVNLRGRRNPLPVPEDRAELAAQLRAWDIETLIVDPFGRAYSGQSQNDAGEVGAWLTDLDMFARSEVGATDLILTAHAGWNGERSRGSTALEDWADAIITMTRGSDNDDARRYIRAIGRDVDIEEAQLDFDQQTRRPFLTGLGGRKEAATEKHLQELSEIIVDMLRTHGGWNTSDVTRALKAQGVGHQKGDPGKALAMALRQGILRVEDGARGAKHYYVNSPTPTYPDVPQPGYVPPTPTPPLRGGVGGEGNSTHQTIDLPRNPETDPFAPQEMIQAP
ncbi:AAA family ATPase [Arthrobacter sp. S39]|uniref:ATP-binding protein n=1 Tax=Arthrobacter sp. S39 TaxID=2509720 RepID=UPI001037D3AF|nr:AAA family ATPase [Arthrobacter sp. S39]TAP45622.1 AAA family ATPase [Arthrobacter sp. S39]